MQDPSAMLDSMLDIFAGLQARARLYFMQKQNNRLSDRNVATMFACFQAALFSSQTVTQ